MKHAASTPDFDSHISQFGDSVQFHMRTDPYIYSQPHHASEMLLPENQFIANQAGFTGQSLNGIAIPENSSAPNQSRDKGAELYKTELCRKWVTAGTCRYGAKCQFAHGENELRTLIRHPLYKTSMCKSYQASGTCRYGSRCRFIHDETDQELSGLPRSSSANNVSFLASPQRRMHANAAQAFPRVPSAPDGLGIPRMQAPQSVGNTVYQGATSRGLKNWSTLDQATDVTTIPKSYSQDPYGVQAYSNTNGHETSPSQMRKVPFNYGLYGQQYATRSIQPSYSAHELNGPRGRSSHSFSEDHSLLSSPSLEYKDYSTAHSMNSSYSSNSSTVDNLSGFSSTSSIGLKFSLDQSENVQDEHAEKLSTEVVQGLLKSKSQPLFSTISKQETIPEDYSIEKKSMEELTQNLDSFHIADLSDSSAVHPPVAPSTIQQDDVHNEQEKTISGKITKLVGSNQDEVPENNRDNQTVKTKTSGDGEGRLDFFRSISNQELAALASNK